jgi:hypothetical protein
MAVLIPVAAGMFKPVEPPKHLPLNQRGSSGLDGTAELRSQLPELFFKHNIKSIFDAGANDASWQVQTIGQHVQYHAGDHDHFAVLRAKELYPDLDIQLHDMTQDPFTAVDLLFVRDVTIHMNNFYKRRLLKNWLSSSIPWLLTTQIQNCHENLDQDQQPGDWYFAEINWHLDPWYFPPAVEKIKDFIDQRFMCLWHRDQIQELACAQ